MSKAKFTPGPWEIRGREVGVSDKSDTQSYGMLNIVAALDTFDFRDQWEANAHLIAAAPRMYRALEAICKGEGLPPGETIERILASARGEGGTHE